VSTVTTLSVLHTLSGFQAEGDVTEVTAMMGEFVSVVCPYSQNDYKSKRKTWCRQINRDQCNLVVSTYYSLFGLIYTEKNTNGRTSIYDNYKAKEITVSIQKVNVDDSGIYQCGIDLSDKVLKVIYLTVYKKLSSEVGMSISVVCPCSPNDYKSKVKTWCKEIAKNHCNPMVSTYLPKIGLKYNEQITTRRTSIYDHQSTKEIMVSIEKLQEDDSGMYWCGIDFPNTIKALKGIHLSVYRYESLPPWTCHEVMEMTALLGESVTIVCKYSPQDHKRKNKTWCKQIDQEYCDLVVETNTNSRNGSTSVYDDKHTGEMTVSIERLKEDDSGVYWCGAINRVPKVTVTVFKKINLKVFKKITAMVGEFVSVVCPYSQNEYKSKEKTWCKEIKRNRCNPVVSTYYSIFGWIYHEKVSIKRTSIYDERETGEITVSIEKVMVEDSGMYWCGI
uniref:Ig-like domain-containing protein n=1 Tax=Latimeria chalumnae TaxID=7897 RepID=H3BGP7_LATCH